MLAELVGVILHSLTLGKITVQTLLSRPSDSPFGPLRPWIGDTT